MEPRVEARRMRQPPQGYSQGAKGEKLKLSSSAAMTGFEQTDREEKLPRIQMWEVPSVPECVRRWFLENTRGRGVLLIPVLLKKPSSKSQRVSVLPALLSVFACFPSPPP